MTKEEFKRIISATVVLTVVAWLLLVASMHKEPFSTAAFQLLSPVVSGIVLFWLFFFRWGWRWPLLKLLLKRPDIGGTWLGTLESNYFGSIGNTANELEIAIVVRQTALFTHVTTFTSRMTAHSYSDALTVDEERGIRRIIYIYSEKPHQSGVGVRQGTAELEIIGHPPKAFEGEYWTNQRTAGRLRVSRVCRELLESYGDSKRRWPENWAKHSGS
jgi:hypothetical protein